MAGYPKRVLILSDRYLPDTTGTALRIARLGQPLLRAHFCDELHIATSLQCTLPDAGERAAAVPPPAYEQIEGVHVHRFSSEWNMLKKLPAIHRRHRFSLVHGRGVRYGFYARLLSTRWHVPSILELNSVNPQRKGIRSILWNYTIRSSDRLIVLSRYAGEWLMRGMAVPEDKIDIVINGVDVKLFDATSALPDFRLRYGLAGARTVGYFGTAVEWQGVFDFVRVAAVVAGQAPDIRFLMVGGGPDLDRTKQLVEHHGLSQRFTFTGPVPPHEVPAHLQIMDVVLMPRPPRFLKNQLASPLKLFEAMAMKKAIVVTPVRGFSEVIIHRQTGLVAGPSTREIASAVMELVRDEGLRLLLGRSARGQIETGFSWESAAGQLGESYLKALG
jgi:glycosyltransferase involved in cell wall biosynthesis